MTIRKSLLQVGGNIVLSLFSLFMLCVSIFGFIYKYDCIHTLLTGLGVSAVGFFLCRLLDKIKNGLVISLITFIYFIGVTTLYWGWLKGLIWGIVHLSEYTFLITLGIIISTIVVAILTLVNLVHKNRDSDCTNCSCSSADSCATESSACCTECSEGKECTDECKACKDCPSCEECEEDVICKICDGKICESCKLCSCNCKCNKDSVDIIIPTETSSNLDNNNNNINAMSSNSNSEGQVTMNMDDIISNSSDSIEDEFNK